MSADRSSVDIGMVIALREEFDSLVSAMRVSAEPEAPQREPHALGYTPPRAFRLRSTTEETLPSICVVMVDDMDSTEALLATQYLMNAYRPSIVLSVGLSGALSRDLQLGDIVIADEVRDYLHRSKATDRLNGDGFDIKSAGTSAFFSKPLLNSFLLVERDDQIAYSSWTTRASHYRAQVLNEQLHQHLREANLLREIPRIHTGLTACGPIVGASKNFVDFLLDQNRTFLSLDMESYGVARAAETTNIPALSIRSICDFSDNRKNELETSSKGNLRKIAIQSIATLLRLYFSTSAQPKLSISSPTDSTAADSESLSKITVMSSMFLGSTTRRARTSRQPPTSDAIGVYSSYVPQVWRHVDDASLSASILIQGGPGSGKSYLLRQIYSHFLRLYRDGNHTYFPVYIDLKMYDPALFLSQDSANAALAQFQSTISCLDRQILDGVESKFVICIDSIDYHAAHRSKLEDHLHGIVKELEDATFIVTVGDDNRNSDRVVLWTSEPSLVLTLRPCEVGSQEADELISLLVSTHNTSHETTAADVKRIVARFDIRELDYLTTRTIIQKARDTVLEKSRSISDFYQSICEEHIKKHTNLSPVDGLSMIAEMAHTQFIQMRRHSQLGDNSHAIWKILHYHSTVQDFLVAYHVVDVLREIGKGSLEKRDHLNYVFPERINRLCKGIMWHGEIVERECVNGAESLHNMFRGKPSNYITAMTHVSYLLGRVVNPNAKRRAKSLLLEWKEEFQRGDTFRQLKFTKIPIERRLLYVRTLFISLAYLGVEDAAEEYIKKLLQNAEWDNLNRGFHLEYYHDRPYLPDERQLAHEDNLEPFPNTFAALVRRIDDYFRTDANPLFEIEWYTLFSLAQHRHAAGVLPDAMKTKLKEFIQRANKSRMSTMVRTYTSMMERSLGSASPSRSVLEQLFSLKGIKRKGWISRGMTSAESVPDHIFGAMLLAELFLPERMGSDKVMPAGYDKAEVLRMLLIHDLAEAYTGDKLPREHDSDVEAAHFAFLEMSSTYRDMPGLSTIRDRWEAFEYSDDINGQVARDIDKIDNLLQLFIYTKSEKMHIGQSHLWEKDLVESVKTEYGRRIVATISDLFRDP